MAISISVDGPCNVKVDTGAANALEQLGYSAEGIDITVEPFNLDVPGDQNGGSDGVPIDVQHFNSVARFTMELTKFDEAVYNKIANMINDLGATTAGTQAVSAGALYAANGNGFRVLLEPTNRPINFILCIPQKIDRNKSSKYTRAVIEWLAYPVSGVLWNTTVV